MLFYVLLFNETIQQSASNTSITGKKNTFFKMIFNYDFITTNHYYIFKFCITIGKYQNILIINN